MEYRQEILKIKARYAFISYTVLPQKERKQKEKKPKKKKDDEKPEKDESKAEKDSSEKIETFLEILRSAKTALKILKDHFIISGLCAHIRVGGEDAHETAVSYGNLMAAATSGLALVSEFLTVKVRQVHIEPDYLIEKSIYDGEVTLRIRPIWAIVAVCSFLFSFIGIYIKNKSKNPKLKVDLKMSQKPVSELTEAAMSNLRTLIDVNTIIGDPINTSGGITIIPFSKVSFGYGAGGADLPANVNDKFAGGSGAGVTIQPLGFIVINGADVQVIQLNTAKNTNDRLVNAGADIANKLVGLIPQKKNAATATSNVTQSEADVADFADITPKEEGTN